MKANIANLKKALKACADAHKVEYHWWKNDGQITLKGETLPVLADVRMIVEAFYGKATVDMFVEQNWGYTIVWLDAGLNTKQDVDEQLLSLALPFDTKLN